MRFTSTRAALATLALSAGIAAPAAAGDVTVTVEGLRNGAGLIRAAVCPPETFTKPGCPYVGAARASGGRVTVTGVPDGVYAVQVFHDEDADGALDRNGFWPTEGLGFSNDAPMRMGPPRFRDAAVRVTGGGSIRLNVRYFP
ncbi:DUF2141 domain-containing protein [Jannaschia sp. Os4]|uniref:DUF2141 domain-containing protein n=1 Tax=Jannaschia sp. Os4 TaxID=2807617 RepID=UPI00193AC58A|nr:DUF2141 domain-containing protein [Jannaschia sp. Os4]MBM2575891.1 DUF2141 domain-containing protein [Jannaschia sp. Os4]